MMALRRNPFVHQGLLVFLYDLLPGNWRDDLVTRAWISYANAELPTALEQFGKAVQRDPKRFGYLRFNRASAFVNLGRGDSASAEVATLLAQLRAEDNATLGDGYQSKELLEYAQGLLHQQARRARAAREAFGRAVTENPGFTPARAALADLATAARDTATALLEYSTAIEVDPKDVMIRLGYGKALLAAARPADAVVQLQRAVSLDPMYAASYYWLGTALEVVSDAANARLAYAQYLARAPRADAWRPEVEERLRVLGAARGR
jgi:predicted Zn-dependent protease